MSRRRRTGGEAHGRAADDPAITNLLDTVREVRTTLAIDLSAAAGALDESETEVARDILSATSDDLTLVSSDIHDAHRDALAARRRSRRTRALLALPAVPLVGALAMTTAAALSGSASPNKPVHHIVTPAVPAHHVSASTALRRLEDVVTNHAKAKRVIAVADNLHKQLTRMIATSTNDPGQLHVVRQLLTLEQHVLEGSKLPGTQLALAASRAIAELLERRPATSQPSQPNTSHETPSATHTSRPTRHARQTQTPAHRGQQPQRTSSTTHASPTPTRANPLFGDGFFNWP